jgi:hypothetical protein
MNSFNYEVCEFNSEQVKENFRTCEEAGGYHIEQWKCRSQCGRGFGFVWECIDP